MPGAKWWGNFGEAYGLVSGLCVDPSRGRVLVYVVTGTNDDPFLAARTSAVSGIEEQLLLELAATPPRR